MACCGVALCNALTLLLSGSVVIEQTYASRANEEETHQAKIVDTRRHHWRDGYVPPDMLTNAELARMVDTSDQWIVERTGIKERHILKGKGLGASHMGAEAVRGLLKKTGTAPGDVDLLICATTTPDFVFPSTPI